MNSVSAPFGLPLALTRATVTVVQVGERTKYDQKNRQFARSAEPIISGREEILNGHQRSRHHERADREKAVRGPLPAAEAALPPFRRRNSLD